jgi:hypothetical protein
VAQEKIHHFFSNHIASDTNLSRKDRSNTFYYIEEILIGQNCLKKNIQELDLYIKQADDENIPASLLGHAISEVETAFIKCKKANKAVINWHMSMIGNGLSADFTEPIGLGNGNDWIRERP